MTKRRPSDAELDKLNTQIKSLRKRLKKFKRSAEKISECPIAKTVFQKHSSDEPSREEGQITYTINDDESSLEGGQVVRDSHGDEPSLEGGQIACGERTANTSWKVRKTIAIEETEENSGEELGEESDSSGSNEGSDIDDEVRLEEDDRKSEVKEVAAILSNKT